MARIPIALQLYSIRKDLEQDLPGTLEAVAKMGYDGVEFAGYYGRTAEELRALLDRFGLRCAGTHTRIDTLSPENLAETIRYNKVLGNKFLIVPSLPAVHSNSRQAWLDAAALFNDIAAQVEPEGMEVGYHNHFVEFQPLEGELPMDTFFGNTRKDVVMQLDLGNAMHGGGKPIDFLVKYPGRSRTIHLKEYSSGYDKALIGEGEVDWQEVFRLCEEQGVTEWYIVEQENYALPPLECVDRCLQNLRAMGK
jgi:sugar phosphate isomerase/epimerase